MTDLFKLLLGLLASLFKARAKLEAEVLTLRQQIQCGQDEAEQGEHRPLTLDNSVS